MNMPRYRKGESNVPGLRERRVSKITGTTVSIYEAEAAGFDTEEGYDWVTVCEDHQRSCSHATLADARSRASSCEWCEDCQGVQFVRTTPDGTRATMCFSCGEPVVWVTEDDEVGDPLCQDGDAILIADCGCCAAGTRVGDHVYCEPCTSAALAKRCDDCKLAQREAVEAMTEFRMIESPNPSVAAVAKQSAGRPDGKIEVVDVMSLPEPEPGSWAATLRQSLLNSKRGKN
jgi:hypothetical protein